MNTKACTEVCEILKYVPEEDYKKIPKKFIQKLEKNKDFNYEFKLQENRKLEEQELLRDTKIILAIIYKNYWATDKEKELINKKIEFDIKKNELKKQEKYGANKLFKK